MANENENTEASSTEEAPTVYSNERKTINVVLAEVANKINTSGAVVRDRVVASLVEKKLSERADKVERALQKLKDLDKEFKKLGPDTELYPEDSDKPVRSFTKARRDERKKVQDNKTKLEKLLEAVLSGKAENGTDATEEHWTKLGEAIK